MHEKIEYFTLQFPFRQYNFGKHQNKKHFRSLYISFRIITFILQKFSNFIHSELFKNLFNGPFLMSSDIKEYVSIDRIIGFFHQMYIQIKESAIQVSHAM